MTSNKLMRSFRSENIPATVSSFRTDGQVPVLDAQHWDGGQCRIFKVDFHSGESWSIRIPIHAQSDSHDTIIHMLQREENVFQELGHRNFRWAPKQLGSSMTFDNGVGFPFIALSWVAGSPLHWTSTDPPRRERDKVLRQIAEIQVTLIEGTKEDG
jgi:hypothetical protein